MVAAYCVLVECQRELNEKKKNVKCLLDFEMNEIILQKVSIFDMSLCTNRSAMKILGTICVHIF